MNDRNGHPVGNGWERGSPDPAVRIMLRPIGSPLPLGFFASS